KAFGCRADGDFQQQALSGTSIVLDHQIGSGFTAAIIEQQRILARALRHDALGQTWNEDDAEGAATRLMRSADEDAAISPGRRIPVKRGEPIVEYVTRLFEGDGTDAGHRSQVGERPEHAIRPNERLLRQRRKSVD